MSVSNSFINGVSHFIPLPVEVNTFPDVPESPPLTICIVLSCCNIRPSRKFLFVLSHFIPLPVEVNTCPDVPALDVLLSLLIITICLLCCNSIFESI